MCFSLFGCWERNQLLNLAEDAKRKKRKDQVDSCLTRLSRVGQAVLVPVDDDFLLNETGRNMTLRYCPSGVDFGGGFFFLGLARPPLLQFVQVL